MRISGAMRPKDTPPYLESGEVSSFGDRSRSSHLVSRYARAGAWLSSIRHKATRDASQHSRADCSSHRPCTYCKVRPLLFPVRHSLTCVQECKGESACTPRGSQSQGSMGQRCRIPQTKVGPWFTWRATRSRLFQHKTHVPSAYTLLSICSSGTFSRQSDVDRDIPCLHRRLPSTHC